MGLSPRQSWPKGNLLQVQDRWLGRAASCRSAAGPNTAGGPGSCVQVQHWQGREHRHPAWCGVCAEACPVHALRCCTGKAENTGIRRGAGFVPRPVRFMRSGAALARHRTPASGVVRGFCRGLSGKSGLRFRRKTRVRDDPTVRPPRSSASGERLPLLLYPLKFGRPCRNARKSGVTVGGPKR